jgi:hypothetical protein
MQASWKNCAFTAKADRALLLNGHDLEVIPKVEPATDHDFRLGDRVRTMVAHDPFLIEVHTLTCRARPPHNRLCNSYGSRTLWHRHIPDGIRTLFVTAGFYGFRWMSAAYSASAPESHSMPLRLVRPGATSWKMFGSDGSSGNWQELRRAGFAQTIEITGNTSL